MMLNRSAFRNFHPVTGQYLLDAFKKCLVVLGVAAFDDGSDVPLGSDAPPQAPALVELLRLILKPPLQNTML